MLEDQIAHLKDSKRRLNEEQSMVEAHFDKKKKKYEDSSDESIILADILSLQHQKQRLQDRLVSKDCSSIFFFPERMFYSHYFLNT